MIFAGILAGGSGTRMENSTMPKQFIEICGEPILIRTLKKFISSNKFDYIIVSMNNSWKDKYVELIHKFKLNENEKIILVSGGDSRFTSLVNIVNQAKKINSSDDNIIVTHDCARIFVSTDIIMRNVDMIKNYDMITTSIPVIDTILQSDDGKSSNFVPDRNKLFADQGPQTFYVNKFLKYVDMIKKEDLKDYIEAGKVYLSHGCKIGIVAGDRYNFKITNDFDLKYAEFLIEGGYVK